MNGDTTDWTDVVDLNFGNQEMRTKMIDAMQYWVREFDIDGYRCDVAHQVPLDFWTAAIDSVETVKPVLMLAEAAEPAMHDSGFDLSYAWPYYGALKEVWEEEAPAHGLLAQVDSTRNVLHERAHRLRFTTNHDESMWDATPIEIFGGRDGSEAAFVLSATLPGVPLMYNGQELGIADTVSFFAAQPYNWEQGDTMVPFYTQVLGTYQSSPALRGGDFEVLSTDSDDVALYRRSADAQELVVVINVRNESTTVDLPAPYQEASFTDLLSDTVVSGPTLTLQPYAYHVLQTTATP
jgi:glycosidase